MMCLRIPLEISSNFSVLYLEISNYVLFYAASKFAQYQWLWEATVSSFWPSFAVIIFITFIVFFDFLSTGAIIKRENKMR